MPDFHGFCQTQIEPLLNAFCQLTNANIGLSLLFKEESYHYKAEEIFPAASTIKVPLLLVALEDITDVKLDISLVKTGGSSLLEYFTGVHQYSLNDLLIAMIALSDNAATNAIIDLIGFHKITDRFYKMELKDTKLQRKMMDFDAIERGLDNTTSPKEMVHLLASLDIHLFESLRFYLSKQLFREGLGFFLPEGIVENKTGSLYSVFNDVGLMKLGTDILFYAYYSSNVNIGESIINAGKIGQLLWRFNADEDHKY